MAPPHHHPDIVGNRDGKDMQGWTFPLPEDDTWSCDGTEESERGTPFESNTSFAQDHIDILAPPHPRSACFDGSTAPTIGTGDGDFSISTNDQEWLKASNHTKWDCRAASGSGREQSQVDCTSRDPWGVIKEAVQTSLELSEPVDIQQLPGLHQLWQKHDLNVEGDAAHFVHSLWLHSQTRVMQYRHTEIKEGGYVKEHIQLPLIVD